LVLPKSPFHSLTLILWLWIRPLGRDARPGRIAEIIGPRIFSLGSVRKEIRVALFLSVFHGDRRHSQPALGYLPIRWMNLPYGFVFENDNFAFLKLIAQPMFLMDSSVEGQDGVP